MHLGIFAKTFPRPSFEETLDAIAGRGITHVQFNMACAGRPTLPERADEDLCVWIARSFRQRGLTMAAISGTFNLCDPDASRLGENLNRLGILASACRWLDTRIITLCTGTRDAEDMWRWHPDNVRRSAWESLVEAMRAAVEVADRHEVTLAFEPERNNVVNSVARARMLLDEIDSPWLKVVIDPANLMRADDRSRLTEILDEAFDWLGPHIILAHAKDPPYAPVGAEMEAIREFLGEVGSKTIGLRLAHMRTTGKLAELGGPLSEHVKRFLEKPVPEPLGLLYSFFFEYVQRLKNLKYSGTLVMHGQPEQEVMTSHDILIDLIERLPADD